MQVYDFFSSSKCQTHSINEPTLDLTSDLVIWQKIFTQIDWIPNLLSNK